MSGGVAGFFGEAPLPPKETAPSTPQKSTKSTSKLSSPPGSTGRSPATRSATRAAASAAAPPSTGHQGHAECFDGLKFAVSGVMDTTGREGIESMVLEYGGKVCITYSLYMIFPILRGLCVWYDTLTVGDCCFGEDKLPYRRVCFGGRASCDRRVQIQGRHG